MANYRDYGTFGNGQAPLVETTKPKTQVYRATHEGDGDTRLPYMYRSFISFSFGGKNIEDFGFIASIDGDRWSRDGYSEFEDLTTDYDVLDGKFYWGTHFTDHELEFTLATDGVTQKQIDEFLRWFSPGKIRELILAEHPNRVIQARVSNPPNLQFIPFEEPTTVKIGGRDYKTSTTLYKGEVELNFTMDDPFWYSKINVFGELDESTGVYNETWTDANGNTVNVADDPDAIKVVLEDGIPFLDMISESMILGDNNYAYVRPNNSEATDATARTTTNAEESNIAEYTSANGEITSWSAVSTSVVAAAARIWSTDNEVSGVGARIDGPQMRANSGIDKLVAKWATGTELEPNRAYFYYAGTAPSKPTITFTLVPKLRHLINEGYSYLYIPSNEYSPSAPNPDYNASIPTTDLEFINSFLTNQNIPKRPYNTITIIGEDKYEFRFSTPSVYSSYNKVMQMFTQLKNGTSWEAIKENIRDYVNHAAVRVWATTVIDYMIAHPGSNGNDTTITFGNTSSIDDDIHRITRYMRYFLLAPDAVNPNTDNEVYTCMPATFSFNSKTGRATGKIVYRTATGTLPANENAWKNYGFTKATGDSDNNGYDNSFTLIENLHEEDVGDMVRSNYLSIEDRNYPDANGNIMHWTANAPTQSHVIYHNVNNGLTNFQITYQNMYY